jgi:hypothetical protein
MIGRDGARVERLNREAEVVEHRGHERGERAGKDGSHAQNSN